MASSFEILAGFLDRFGDEVEGRELPEPPPEIQDKLRNLARGALPEGERAELLAQLNRNPGWIARLAVEIKALRAGPDASKPE
jgi:hypothetical protein